jgi:hypothetical protein
LAVGFLVMPIATVSGPFLSDWKVETSRVKLVPIGRVKVRLSQTLRFAPACQGA